MYSLAAIAESGHKTKLADSLPLQKIKLAEPLIPRSAWNAVQLSDWLEILLSVFCVYLTSSIPLSVIFIFPCLYRLPIACLNTFLLT